MKKLTKQQKGGFNRWKGVSKKAKSAAMKAVALARWSDRLKKASADIGRALKRARKL